MAGILLADGATLGASPPPEAIRETARRIVQGESFDLADPDRKSAMLAELWTWLKSRLADLFDFLTPDDPLRRRFMFWVLMALAAVGLVALAAYLARHIYKRYSRIPDEAVEAELDLLDWEALAARAESLAGDGNYADAVRTLYRATLIRLETERGGRVRPGLTNNEYLRTFRSSWVTENLEVFAELINWKWYPARPIGPSDYARCREAYARLDERLRETA